MPRRRFILYYDGQEGREYQGGVIRARAADGTRVTVGARVGCRVGVGEALKGFLEDYGLDWQKYALGYGF